MLSKLAITLALAATALGQTFSINTPAAIIQCQPASISWTGGTAPYILATIPGGQTGAAAISTLSSSLTSSPYTWTVDLASGTYITLRLTDAQGNIAYSSPLTVQAGSSDSCLNSSASTSGVATTGAVTTTGSGSSVLTGTTSASATANSNTSVAVVSSSVSVSRASSAAASSASSAAASSASTPVSRSSASSAATSAASATSTGAALPSAVAGVPAVLAGVVGGLALLI